MTFLGFPTVERCEGPGGTNQVGSAHAYPIDPCLHMSKKSCTGLSVKIFFQSSIKSGRQVPIAFLASVFFDIHRKLQLPVQVLCCVFHHPYRRVVGFGKELDILWKALHMASSAYLTNPSPLFSISLSNGVKYTFASSGLSGPPQLMTITFIPCGHWIYLLPLRLDFITFSRFILPSGLVSRFCPLVRDFSSGFLHTITRMIAFALR